jgi:chemotaxis protein methyltransferase WspC
VTSKGATRAGKPKFDPPPDILTTLANAAAAIAGMHPSMIEERSLRQTLLLRMKANDIGAPDAYLGFFHTSLEEQTLFLEGVLIGETCFFRDATVFAEMSRWCVAWFAEHQRPLRILSAPCSTGEEPYSIAATLQQAGFEPEQFSIDALDISSFAIEHARTALYRGFSLRNIPQPEQASFLDHVSHGWKVKQQLRERVHFRQANLMDAETLKDREYDLICSRNLLLYQSSEARRHLSKSLSGTLAANGRLVIGAADWGRDLDEFFLLEKPVHSFALRQRQPGKIVPKREAHTRKPSIGVPPRAATKTKESRVVTALRMDAAAMAEITLLANVTELYRQAIQAYLGGNEHESERLCRQTLYLETDHMPSLELLTKIKRPHASNRMKLALHARLQRHRDAAVAGVAR